MNISRAITIASLVSLGCLSQAGSDSWFYALIPGTSGTAGIYQIDTGATFGQATQLYSGQSGTSVGDLANGLAYDYDTSTFYWTNSDGKLHSWSTSSSKTAAYTTQDPGLQHFSYDNATYFNNTYIYDTPSSSGPGTNYSVNLTSLGQTSQTVNNLAVFGYGDIAYNSADSNVYAWGSGGEEYKFAYDPSTTMTATALPDNGTYSRDIQIAFDSSNTLYGIEGTTGMIYTVDPTSGLETATTKSAHPSGGQTLTGWEDAASGHTPASTPEPFTVGLAIAGLGIAVRRLKAGRNRVN